MDPDDRTRPLRPAEPGPPAREVVTEYEHDPFRAEVLDRLSSLRTGLVLVGVLATAALGVALWSLLAGQEDPDDDRRGVSSSRVTGIEERLDELENRVDERATKNAVGDVADEQQELSDRIEALEQAAEEDGGGDEEAAQQLQQSVDELDQRLDDLEQRVEDAENQEPAQP